MSQQLIRDEDLQHQLTSVIENFQHFVERQRYEIQKARHDHNQQTQELRVQHKAISEKLESLDQKEEELSRELETYTEELEQTEERLARDHARLLEIEEERKVLQRQHDELQQKVEQSRAELISAKMERQKQDDQNLPEVELYERLLGIKISSSKPDVLKFTFVNIDQEFPDKEYEVTLDVSEEDYKIVESNPAIHETDQVQGYLTLVNDDRDIVKFLKMVRSVFKTL